MPAPRRDRGAVSRSPFTSTTRHIDSGPCSACAASSSSTTRGSASAPASTTTSDGHAEGRLRRPARRGLRRSRTHRLGRRSCRRAESMRFRTQALRSPAGRRPPRPRRGRARAAAATRPDPSAAAITIRSTPAVRAGTAHMTSVEMARAARRCRPSGRDPAPLELDTRAPRAGCHADAGARASARRSASSSSAGTGTSSLGSAPGSTPSRRSDHSRSASPRSRTSSTISATRLTEASARRDEQDRGSTRGLELRKETPHVSRGNECLQRHHPLFGEQDDARRPQAGTIRQISSSALSGR